MLKRNKNIDFTKGLLILIVIAGHIIPGELNNTLSRNLIYSFHMPLFIGIAGYLINQKKLKDNNFTVIVKGYLLRLVIPWIIAMIVFFLIRKFSVLEDLTLIELKDLILWQILKPWYHLWFVPGFLFYIFLTYLLYRFKLKTVHILILSLLISMIVKFVPFNFLTGRWNTIYELIKYNFRLYNYFFFILGIYIKEFWNQLEIYRKSIKIIRIWTLVSFISVILLFYWPNSIMTKFNFFVFNTTLLFVVIEYMVSNMGIRSKIIEFIGRNSFAFYLWHMLGILMVGKIMSPQDNLILYIILNALIFYLEFFIIKLINTKTLFLRKIILGFYN